MLLWHCIVPTGWARLMPSHVAEPTSGYDSTGSQPHNLNLQTRVPDQSHTTKDSQHGIRVHFFWLSRMVCIFEHVSA
jgi:hypothetical protein